MIGAIRNFAIEMPQSGEVRNLCIYQECGTIPSRSPFIIATDREATMMYRTSCRIFVAAAALSLAACGTTTGDRAVSGGMIGAGTGAVLGAITGNPAAGAAFGALGGAVVGAVTNPCQLDLGKPFWREHGGREGYERRCGHPPPR